MDAEKESVFLMNLLFIRRNRWAWPQNSCFRRSGHFFIETPFSWFDEVIPLFLCLQYMYWTYSVGQQELEFLSPSSDELGRTVKSKKLKTNLNLFCDKCSKILQTFIMETHSWKAWQRKIDTLEMNTTKVLPKISRYNNMMSASETLHFWK